MSARHDYDVLLAARRWWESRRPVAWTLGEHLANPEVNCVTPSEKALAKAVGSKAAIADSERRLRLEECESEVLRVAEEVYFGQLDGDDLGAALEELFAARREVSR